MIGRLRGEIISKNPPQLLLDVNGVGYEIEASMSTFYQLPEAGQQAILYTHLTIRDDAHLLYGFYDLNERSLFRELIKVNGVGPKLALTILSGMETSQFVRAIVDNDPVSLTKMPGVGKKTAERLIIEMRDCLSDADISSHLPQVVPAVAQQNNMEQDAVGALVALGYKPQDASRMVSRVLDEASSSEELIRLALKATVS